MKKLFILMALLIGLLFTGAILISCGDDSTKDDDNGDDDDNNDDKADDDDDNDDATDDDGGNAPGSGVWTDSKTGLIWQNEDLGQSNTNLAKGYCEKLELGGFDDWRLPSVSELRTLIRNCPETETGGSCAVSDDNLDVEISDTKSGVGCDGCISAEGCFWPSELTGKCTSRYDTSFATSSGYPKDKNYVWYVRFIDAHIGIIGATTKLKVRCVRGGA